MSLTGASLTTVNGIPAWARRFDGTDIDEYNNSVILSDGSIVVCGVTYSSGSINLGSGAVNGTIPGASVTANGGGAVIIRYNANGDVIWYRNPPFMLLPRIAVDASDNIYLCGLLWANSSNMLTNAFGGDTTAFTATKSTAGDDAILVKIRTDGRILWSRIVAGTGSAQEYASGGVTVDFSGNVYMAVNVNSAGENLTLTSNAVGESVGTFSTMAKPAGSGEGILIAKYTANGAITWARLIEGGSAAVTQVATDIAVDSAANVYLTGFVNSETINFTQVQQGGDTGGSLSIAKVNTSGNNEGGFLVKYNANGRPQWVRQVDGALGERIEALKIDG
jgi:hypothetical protein